MSITASTVTQMSSTFGSCHHCSLPPTSTSSLTPTSSFAPPGPRAGPPTAPRGGGTSPHSCGSRSPSSARLHRTVTRGNWSTFSTSATSSRLCETSTCWPSVMEMERGEECSNRFLRRRWREAGTW